MGDRLHIEMPLQVRLAPVSTVDAEARTAELVFSRGGQVRRYDWMRDEEWIEELSMDPAHVRLGRLQNGAPLLDTHARWSLNSVIGVVEAASVDGTQGVATVRFSEREDVQPIFQDVRAGIIRNVSVGYTVHRMEEIGRDDRGRRIMRAVDWEPMEISLVPVPADAGAAVRSEEQRSQGAAPQLYGCEVVLRQPAAIPAADHQETQMSGTQERSAGQAAENQPAAPTAEQLDQVRREATEAERRRCTEIRALVTRHQLDDEVAQRFINENVTLDAARLQVLELLAQRSEATPTRSGTFVEVTSDETVNRREAMVNAVMHRALPGHVQLTDAGRQWRGYTLRELMRECLELRGVKTRGMSVSQMWERTYQSGSDLPYIVLDAANKSLQRAYEATARSFVPWCRQSTAPDFKNINRVQLSGAPSLIEVKSGGEFQRGAVSDGKETYQLVTYGRTLGINRQTIINDDMDAFTRLPELCARAAADLESDTVYGILTANGNMADGVALFHANHGNLAGSGAAIAVATLGAGRAAMRKQTGLEGRPINVRPAFLIVPATQETVAEQYTSADFVSAKSSDVNPFRTGRQSALQVAVEPRLDATSDKSWYLAADPAQIDTIEYAYLEGQEGVYMESRIGFEVDGLELKVRLDFAAKALDYRGMYKNPGA